RQARWRTTSMWARHGAKPLSQQAPAAAAGKAGVRLACPTCPGTPFASPSAP
ncbi:unnamed protein product, partial [Prorocentrum cordatum]